MMEKKRKFLGIADDSRLLDLPDEIEIDIVERLNSTERVRFSAVCKAAKLLLQRLLPFAAEPKEFPWFMAFNYHKQCLVLREPCLASHQMPRATIKRDLKQEPIGTITKGRPLFPVATKYGWVVFTFRDINNIINDIDLDVSSSNLFRCVFSVISTNNLRMMAVEDSLFEIYTCRHGDKSCWKKHHTIDWGWGLESMTLLEGSFYWKVYLSKVVTCNVAGDEILYQVLVNSEEPPRGENSPLFFACPVLALDGDILLLRSTRPVNEYCGV